MWIMKRFVISFLIATIFISCSKENKMNNIPDDAIVRISIGYYPPDKEEIVEEKLNTIFKEKIMPAVKKLDGNINYFVAMDKDKKFAYQCQHLDFQRNSKSNGRNGGDERNGKRFCWNGS